MNIFQKLGVGIADVGKFVADAVRFVIGTAEEVARVLRAEKPLQKPFVDALAKVVTDVESLITNCEGAVTADGLNFAADSAAYAAFLKLIADYKPLSIVVVDALDVLEGKPVPKQLAGAQAPATAKNTDPAYAGPPPAVMANAVQHGKPALG